MGYRRMFVSATQLIFEKHLPPDLINLVVSFLFDPQLARGGICYFLKL